MPHSWMLLPAELRLAILEDISIDCRRNQLKRIQPKCAAVCREWQIFFEKELFRKIVLRISCLDDFDRLIERRRAKRSKKRKRTYRTLLHGSVPPIKHIWLRVELESYSCEVCKTQERSEETTRNNIIFTDAIWKLLTILATVRRLDFKGESNSMIFEFSAHSPSDGHHMFKHCYSLRDDYPHLASIDYQAKYIKKKLFTDRHIFQDEFHGFKDGRALAHPRQLNRNRMQQARRLVQPLSFNFRDLDLRRWNLIPLRRLPRVNIVTDFVIRRQFYRDLSPTTLGQLLEQSFPKLVTMRHERWRLISIQDRQKDDYNYGKTTGGLAMPPDNLLCHKLPCNLTRLHIFEEYGTLQNGRDVQSRPRVCTIDVLRSLKDVAASLEHISVSFLTDAWVCFSDTEHAPRPYFPNLKSIALTSQRCLRKDQSAEMVNLLLVRAARSARKMPKLEIMELWNTECLLRYERPVSHETHTITYASTWADRDIMQAETLEAWQLVDRSRELIPSWKTLPVSRHLWIGTILHHLKLREMILDPTSLIQVRAEVGDFGKHGEAAYNPR